MKISVVIPTYNRLEQLKKILSGFEVQTYPPDQFEVLVISDGSSDGTDEYLQSLQPTFQLKFFSQVNQGAATARNLGVSKAVGDIVLFIDDDIYPLPRLIAEHLCFHDRYGDKAVVIGPMLAPPDTHLAPWVRWEADRLAEQYHDMTVGNWAPTARQFYTGNSSIARSHLIESGGFNPSFKRAEDVELAYRLAEKGLAFYFNPLAAGYHYAERSYSTWMAIPYAYGRNDVIFANQCGQSWLLPAIKREYTSRHLLLRFFIQTFVSRPVLTNAAEKILQGVTFIGETTRQDALAFLGCSGLFNLRYYQGLIDQMGGRDAFFRWLKTKD